jgi:hypothetical protein
MRGRTLHAQEDHMLSPWREMRLFWHQGASRWIGPQRLLMRESREGQITKATAGGLQKLATMRKWCIHEVRWIEGD